MSKRARDESEGAASSDAQEPPAAKAGHTASAANLTRLPSAAMYEQSFMHRDHVSHTLVTSSDFLVTCSRDGQLKFWKKLQKGIEFVKHFRAHMAPISGVAATADGSLLATTAADKAFKVFDVHAFDMISWVKLDFTPTVCEWIGGGSSRAKPTLAIADADAPPIRLYDATGEGGALVGTVSVHTAPVLQMRVNAPKECVVSVDARGVIEYWTTDGDHGAPKDVTFRFKTDTDLCARAILKATSLRADIRS